jgi:hypothetical protein
MAPPARTHETRTHEQTINTALAEILEGLGRTWAIRSEDIGGLFEEGGRPDILIEKSDGWPIVIEAEVANHRQAEVEARSRICKTIAASAHKLHAVVALVYPDDLRRHRGQGLREAIRTARFDYALFSTDKNEQEVRFPAAGWIKGGVRELAVLLHRSSIPAWRVEALADRLGSGPIKVLADRGIS